MISERRAKETLEYFLAHGEAETAKHYSISVESVHRYLREANNSGERHPKVLLFDIETAPLLGMYWSPYQKYIGYEAMIEDWFVISWSAKWLFSKEIVKDVVTPEEAVKMDDGRIMKSLWKLMDEADIIISHNGKKFDHKKSNTRFILNKLTPPSPYQVIDTLEVSKKYFAFTYNRLDFLGRLMKNKQKLETDFELWIRCKRGDQEALDYMNEYCPNDTFLLEEVYLELRPWIKSHPNMAIYQEAQNECCPNCGSDKIEENGYYVTPAGKFEAIRCKSCGAPSRRRKSVLSKKEKDNLLVSVAR